MSDYQILCERTDYDDSERDDGEEGGDDAALYSEELAGEFNLNTFHFLTINTHICVICIKSQNYCAVLGRS